MKLLKRKLQIILLSVIFGILTTAAVQAENMKININTATEQQLCELKRIGPSYATRIIAYREQNGPFLVPEDIMKVKGIGPKTFEVNKEMISVKEDELVKSTQ